MTSFFSHNVLRTSKETAIYFIVSLNKNSKQSDGIYGVCSRSWTVLRVDYKEV